MLRPFALLRPASVAEASAWLAEHGEDAALYAGGTELLLLMKEGLVRPRVLIDLKRVPGLAEISATDGTVSIGATASHRAVERSAVLGARCPLVARVARHVANGRVRTVGTVGGNLAFADPHSDLAAVFLTLDATVTLAGPEGARDVPLGEFVVGSYETTRRAHEVLTAARLRPWPDGTAAAYLKFGAHERPTLGVAAALVLDDERQRVREARLAIGCIGPRPQRLAGLELRLRGMPVAELARGPADLFPTAGDGMEAATDLHGSAEYKLEMAQVFLRRTVRVAAARATGEASHASYPYTVVV